ncbi:hypothetical protein CDAR_113401, partial [Caerostris darwini]
EQRFATQPPNPAHEWEGENQSKGRRCKRFSSLATLLPHFHASGIIRALKKNHHPISRPQRDARRKRFGKI